jgi:hypothetical protein
MAVMGRQVFQWYLLFQQPIAASAAARFSVANSRAVSAMFSCRLAARVRKVRFQSAKAWSLVPDPLGVLWAIRGPGGAVADFETGYSNPAMAQMIGVPTEASMRLGIAAATRRGLRGPSSGAQEARWLRRTPELWTLGRPMAAVTCSIWSTPTSGTRSATAEPANALNAARTAASPELARAVHCWARAGGGRSPPPWLCSPRQRLWAWS